MALDVIVSVAQTPADFFQLIRLREEVFVVEQHVPIQIELDEHDDRATHLIVRLGSDLIGTARLVVDGSLGKIGRMAIQYAYRRNKVGHALMDHLVRLARDKGLTRLVLHAQEQTVAFYRKMGFQPEGPAFQEAGISHRKMVRSL